MERFNFACKDHAEIVKDCIERIKAAYPGRWNDFYEDSTGVMMVESFAYIADLLLYYLDHTANESFLTTAQERQSIINLCKLVGYRVANARPSSVDLLFSLNQPATDNVVIPALTQVSTRSGVIFETISEVTIRAGERQGKGGAVEGQTFSEMVARSNGKPQQEYHIPRVSVLEVVGVAVNGAPWSAVDSTAEQGPGDTVFMVDSDAWGRARITFGDGARGQIPQSGANIQVTYRVGGGAYGNVLAGTITVVQDVTGVGLSVLNPDSASGGADQESLERVRIWAPRYFQAQNRCVTQTDYETIAMTFQDASGGAIAKSRAIVRERSGEANIIRYYVLAYAKDGSSVATPSDTLKSALLEYVNRFKMLTDWIEVKDGRVRPVDVTGTLRIAAGAKWGEVTDCVRDSLAALVSVDAMEMGGKLHISDLYAAIDNTPGVRSVELITPAATVTPQNDELLVLGNVNFTHESTA